MTKQKAVENWFKAFDYNISHYAKTCLLDAIELDNKSRQKEIDELNKKIKEYVFWHTNQKIELEQLKAKLRQKE